MTSLAKVDVHGSSADPEDAQAINRIRSGDSSAVSELDAKYRSRLEAVAQKFVCNRADAADVVQDTLTRVFADGKLVRFDITRPFWNWICVICRNVALSHLRRRYVPTVPSTQAVQLPLQGVPAANQTENLELIPLMLEILSDEERAVLVLNVLEGLSGQETADLLQIPVGTVYSRKSNALEKLRQDPRVQEWSNE